MAGRGPAPKDPQTRRRRNQDTISGATLVDDGVAYGPTLADETGRPEWRAEVVKWFETWRRSPQAKIFTATDWQRLGMLAYLVESYYKRPSMAALSEIRLNEERLGATLVDRQRARLSIERPETDEAPRSGEPGAVVDMAERRASLRDRLAAEQ